MEKFINYLWLSTDTFPCKHKKLRCFRLSNDWLVSLVFCVWKVNFSYVILIRLLINGFLGFWLNFDDPWSLKFSEKRIRKPSDNLSSSKSTKVIKYTSETINSNSNYINSERHQSPPYPKRKTFNLFNFSPSFQRSNKNIILNIQRTVYLKLVIQSTY